MVSVAPKVKYIDAIAKLHEGRLWAFTKQGDQPLYPIHKRCLEIFPTCFVYYRKKEKDKWLEYKVMEILTINQEQQVTLENKDSRLTDKISNCTRVTEGQSIRGFMAKSDDDTKTDDELCAMDFHRPVPYFYIEEEKREDNIVLAKVIMEAVQESMTNSKNIIECLKEKGYKLVKE